MKKQLGKRIGIVAISGMMLAATSMAFAYPPPGPPPGHDNGWSHQSWYHKGGRVPSQYRGGNYVVSNYHQYNLPPPRRGYHYIRSDNGDFLLAAVATGAIIGITAASH